MTKTELKNVILKRIERASKSDPVTADEIAEYTRMYGDWTHRKIRLIITELIEEGNPIGSNSAGFFLIRTKDQLQVYLNSLMKKQVALSARILNVYNAFNG